ncbi:uncharacterized protein [Hoplias malabaricus]|uniref:uncharacterized protein n=1 Tax=Hoplias malabaricus TaxID=27720 RepID=UPI0034632DA4
MSPVSSRPRVTEILLWDGCLLQRYATAEKRKQTEKEWEEERRQRQRQTHTGHTNITILILILTMSTKDLESGENGAARSGCRRMDACLISAVLVLFALFIAALAGALFFALKLQSQMNSLREPDGEYKAGSSAYLRATNSEVKSGVMEWESIQYGKGSTVGSKFSYHSDHHSLKVNKAGSYFLYVQLNLTCNHQCESGSLDIIFEDNTKNQLLQCTVDLPKNNQPVAHKCWDVIPHLVKGSRLLARISSQTDLKNWVLGLNSSGFGMFLVDGLETE